MATQGLCHTLRGHRLALYVCGHINPHQCPVSRGTEEVCDVSGRIKDGTQAAGHEPGNALSNGTFPSKPSYKRLSPFYR